MLSQFTNYFLLFILLSFYVATVIRFYQYLINDKNDIVYKIVCFLWSIVIAPFACFYELTDILVIKIENEEELTDKETIDIYSGFDGN